MEKVKLPKEVAEAIDFLRNQHSESDRSLLGLLFEERVREKWPVDRTIHEWANMNRDAYIQAIVNGFEVEHSPEDKVREVYEFYKHKDERGNVYDGPTVARIIRDVVIDLGIKIEGVNA